MKHLLRFLKAHFYTVSVLAVLVVAFLHPPAFRSWFGVDLFIFVGPSIQLIMFGMGTTLTVGDFIGVARQPWKVAIGTFLQFAIMPLTALLVTKVFRFDGELAAGMILIGSVAGGMASNVIAYLARANVPLSVALTCVSTLVSPFVTPLLMKVLAGTYIEVNVLEMMAGMFKIVLIPVGAGLAVRALFRRVFETHGAAANRILSGISIFAICFNLGIIVAPNHDRLLEAGVLLVLAATVHILAGYSFGYWSARLVGWFLPMDERDARTIAIEVGMQNAGMASALAVTVLHSSLAALPANAAAILGSTTAPLLANYWSGRPPKTSSKSGTDQSEKQ